MVINYCIYEKKKNEMVWKKWLTSLIFGVAEYNRKVKKKDDKNINELCNLSHILSAMHVTKRNLFLLITFRVKVYCFVDFKYVFFRLVKAINLVNGSIIKWL